MEVLQGLLITFCNLTSASVSSMYVSLVVAKMLLVGVLFTLNFKNMELININIANVVFNCPYCNLEYNDCDDNYVDRCNKNKSKCTSVKCSCGNKFYMTYNFKGDAVSFKRESTLNAY